MHYGFSLFSNVNRAAANILLDDPDAVAALLDSLRNAGAHVNPDSLQSTVEAFYRTYYRKLLGHAMFVGAPREEAEDAVDLVIIEMIKQKSRSRKLIDCITGSGMRASDLAHDFEQQDQLTRWPPPPRPPWPETQPDPTLDHACPSVRTLTHISIVSERLTAKHPLNTASRSASFSRAAVQQPGRSGSRTSP